MPSEMLQGFVPFGEFKPDLRYLVNDGLLVCDNLVPVHGDLVSAPAVTNISQPTTEIIIGMYTSKASGNSYVATVDSVVPTGGDLIEATEAGGVTNRTRTAALNYTITAVESHGTQVGPNIVVSFGGFAETVASAYEPVQYLASGAARFANMITSTFEPRGVFPFSLRDNLFLARCFLPAGYDGLSSGLNDTLVAWSKNLDIRQFGSQNANPEIVGAGYQALNYDLGGITAGVAGSDYGMVGMRDGIVRIDGPPYTFRVVTRTTGCMHGGVATTRGGMSMCAAGEDVFFLSPSGLCRLRGGDGQPELIGLGKFSRWLLDGGFNTRSYIGGASHLAYDPVNDLLFLSWTLIGGSPPHDGTLVYNVREDRAAFWPGVAKEYIGLGLVRPSNGWLPGRDLRFTEGNTYQKFAAGQSAGGNAVIQKGYIQFKVGQSTRLLRVRPIYNVTNQAAIEKVTVHIESTNKPYATPTTKGPYTTVDTTGWIVCPDSVFADFHSIKFTVTANANMHKMVEYQGFEYQAVPEGAYGA